MSKLPRLSGAEVIKILVKEFGFQAVRQKGSHIALRKVVTIVPLHKEVKLGTLFSILELAGIDKEEFLRKI